LGAAIDNESLLVWSRYPVELRTKEDKRLAPVEQLPGRVRYSLKAIGWDGSEELQLWITFAGRPAVSLLLSPEGAQVKLK
jgi:hypothetical protein